jgi:predicted alpha/beta superfamily hydrolase
MHRGQEWSIVPTRDGSGEKRTRSSRGKPGGPRMTAEHVKDMPFAMQLEPSRLVRSEGFGWDHEIQVALPASYRSSATRYPVLWVTDGSIFFEMALGIIHLLSVAGMPEMIVVGVGSTKDTAKVEHVRRRMFEFNPWEDLAFDDAWRAEYRRREPSVLLAAGGGADLFLAALVDQIRPRVSHQYRVADTHWLFGASAGGIFTAYALLRRPTAFTHYICGSPPLSISRYRMFDLEAEYAGTHTDLDARLFLAAGANEIAEMAFADIVGSTARFAQKLHSRGYASLRIATDILAGESHATAPPLILSRGVRALARA